jgi:hypothetical protein
MSTAVKTSAWKTAEVTDAVDAFDLDVQFAPIHDAGVEQTTIVAGFTASCGNSCNTNCYCNTYVITCRQTSTYPRPCAC